LSFCSSLARKSGSVAV